MANSILRIKEVLKEKDLTINDLAKKMGINRVTLSNMINGNPTLDTLKLIAHNLNVPIWEIFSEEEDKMAKIFRWDTARGEFIFSAFDENVSLNVNFNDTFINFSLKICSKDVELITSLSEKEEFFKELFKPHLDIRNYLLRIVRNGNFIIRILSLETSLTLLEFESLIKAISLLRNSYLSEQYTIIKTNIK